MEKRNEPTWDGTQGNGMYGKKKRGTAGYKKGGKKPQTSKPTSTYGKAKGDNKAALIAASDGGMSMVALEKEFPNAMNTGGMRGSIMTRRMMLSRPRSFKSHTTVYTGDARTGKTASARTLAYSLTDPDDVFVAVRDSETGRLTLDGYDGQTVVIINEYSGQFDPLALNELLDRDQVVMNVKYSRVNWAPHYIIITSNTPVHEWYTEDQLAGVEGQGGARGLAALMGRIDVLVDFTWKQEPTTYHRNTKTLNQSLKNEVNLEYIKDNLPEWSHDPNNDDVWWPPVNDVQVDFALPPNFTSLYGKRTKAPVSQFKEVQNTTTPMPSFDLEMPSLGKRRDGRESLFTVAKDQSQDWKRPRVKQEPIDLSDEEAAGDVEMEGLLGDLLEDGDSQ